MARQQVEGLRPDVVEQIVALNPELRDQMFATVKAEIERWQAVLAGLGGGKRGRRAASSAGPITDSRTHADAIRHALSLSKFAAGATSRELREYLENSGHPLAPALFASTMQNLKKSGEITQKGKRGSMTYKLKA